MGGYFSYNKCDNNYNYNWIRDSLDNRDIIKSYSEKSGETHIDLRKHCPGIYNSRLNDSVTSSLAAMYEYYKILDDRNFIDIPSRLFMYYNERQLLNTIPQDSGSQIRIGLRAMNKFGVSMEKFWRYDIDNLSIKPPDKCYINANHSIYYFRLNQDLNTLKQSLIKKLPFVFGCCVYRDYLLSKLNGGLLLLPDKKEEVEDYISFMCVGFDDKKKHFIIRNNQGLLWGDKGYGYIPYFYILNKNLCTDFWSFRIKNPKITNIGE